MTTEAKNAVLVYTEATPNPETLKFVTNQVLLQSFAADFPDEASTAESPMAQELFGFPFVKGVFIASNFVTVTKTPETDWHSIIPSIRDFIKGYLLTEKLVVTEKYKQQKEAEMGGPADADADEKIKQLLEKYVKPAVEMDGGAIIFKSFDDGVVTLQLQGACSGCPSSMVTLKAGIEGLLKRMMPGIKEVVAEEV